MSAVNFPRKTTFANIAAFVAIVLGLSYGIYTSNTDVVLLVTGAGIGYLFKGGSNGN